MELEGEKKEGLDAHRLRNFDSCSDRSAFTRSLKAPGERVWCSGGAKVLAGRKVHGTDLRTNAKYLNGAARVKRGQPHNHRGLFWGVLNSS